MRLRLEEQIAAQRKNRQRCVFDQALMQFCSTVKGFDDATLRAKFEEALGRAKGLPLGPEPLEIRESRQYLEAAEELAAQLEAAVDEASVYLNENLGDAREGE
jgi:hypothetical protein